MELVLATLQPPLFKWALTGGLLLLAVAIVFMVAHDILSHMPERPGQSSSRSDRD